MEENVLGWGTGIVMTGIEAFPAPYGHRKPKPSGLTNVGDVGSEAIRST